MGKKKKYNGITFDSQEELDFYWWLEEAKDIDMVLSFAHHPSSILLSPKATKTVKRKGKLVERSLLRKHEYTPDYTVWFSPEFESSLYSPDDLCYIDVKGGFNLYNNHREFSINQKWLWYEKGIFVNKLEPSKWFKEQWCPMKALLTPKTKVIRKKYRHCKILKDLKENSYDK